MIYLMMKYQTIFAVAALAALTACGSKPQSDQNDVETPVSVQELRKGSISKLIHTTGTAQAACAAELVSEISGMYGLQRNPATGKPYKLGDGVRKGQLIIRLENKEYENGIALESKMLNLEIARQEQSKQKALYEKGGVTLSEMRNTDVKAANARYELENANISLEKMNIKAPFDGVIVSLPHYTSDSRVEQGKPMVSIMSYTSMYMDVNLPESTIPYIRVDQPVHVTHYTLPEDTLKGVISELSPAISTETRTFTGRIRIDNAGQKLRPGMFIKVDIVVEQADSAIIIPKHAVLSARDRKYVYVVEKNTAVARQIRTGLEDDESIQVTEGLNEHDHLIVKGFETLRENSRVKVLK